MFDSVLGKGSAPKSRLGAGTVISIAFHAALLLGVFMMSTYEPEEEEGPEATVTFFAAPPPPPPPPPPPKRKSSQQKVEKKIIKKPDVIQQPKTIPIEKPPEVEPAPEEEITEEEDEGVEGGVEGGVVGGVVGGVLGGVVGGQLGGQLGSEVLPFGEGMTRPVKLEGREPQYTREALEARVQGLMIVKCVITIEGKVENCRIIKPLPHMEQAVLQALSTQRYKPVTFQGRPVSVDYVFNIRLVLPK